MRAKPTPRPQSGMALLTVDGARKYLTTGERDAFLRAAEQADRQVRTLCMTLAFAGCRLSEALALTVDRVDLVAGLLVLESLKKRRSGIYRAVPVPPALLEALDLVHGIRELQGLPLNSVQKWLGHAQLTTTAIYADAVGEEEQSIAARMW
jgi:integrase/recombinase XerD